MSTSSRTLRLLRWLAYPWSQAAWDKHGPEYPGNTIGAAAIVLCLAAACLCLLLPL